MKFKMEMVSITDLKPDPNQPRKKFDKKAIENLAKTIHGHKIINPIEADENNVIITGELRWRAGKEAGQEKILIKRIIGLNPKQRFKRQLIENLHHNLLSSVEKQKAILEAWNNEENKTEENIKEFADELGINESWARHFIRFPKIKKEIGSDLALKLGMTKTYDIQHRIEHSNDRKKVAEKAVKENLTRDQIREVAKIIKEVPKDVKEEILKPKSEITIENAKEISEFPEPEQRKQVIEQIKRTKQVAKKIINEQKKIAKKEAPPRIVKIPPINERQVKKWQDLYFQITQQFNVENLLDYSQETQLEGIKIMQKAYKFIFKEVNRYGKRV